MGWIRIILKAPVLAMAVCLAYVAAAGGGWFASAWGRLARRPGAASRWQAVVFRCTARGLAAILGMRIEVRGIPPAEPFVLVSNHLSYVDVILIGSQIGCVFISKAEVEDWPLIGPLVRSVGTLFIDRDAKRALPEVARRMELVLKNGRGVVFFPEGTTSRGDKVAAFQASLLEPAARSRHPVHYASLSYRTHEGCPSAAESVCWWGKMKFTTHILQLLAMPGFKARLTFGTEPIREDDRKVLAARLHRAIEQQFEAVG